MGIIAHIKKKKENFLETEFYVLELAVWPRLTLNVWHSYNLHHLSARIAGAITPDLCATVRWKTGLPAC